MLRFWSRTNNGINDSGNKLIMQPDFSVRSTLPEKMDDESVSISEIHQALIELEKINRLLGGYNVVFNALNKIKWPKRLVTIMDLGSGGGDMLRAIAEWAKKNNKQVQLIGVDRNPVMTKFANEKSNEISNIQFITMDVFDDRLLEYKADITMCTLFCHHFDDDKLVALIKRMCELTSYKVIVNDLDRNWFAYHSFKLISGLFSKSALVKYDGPLSVARSLTRENWISILEKAQITNFTLVWKWAWRWQLIINKETNA